MKTVYSIGDKFRDPASGHDYRVSAVKDYDLVTAHLSGLWYNLTNESTGRIRMASSAELENWKPLNGTRKTPA